MAANTSAEKKNTLIYDLSLPELKDLLGSWGEKSFRAAQIWQGLYKQFWHGPDQYTTLSKSTRQKLSEHVRFTALEPIRELSSRDGLTVKTLFRLPDGPAIEAVLMRYEQRRTLCISTQVGCAMNCSFCATGQMGFTRHLTSGEIVEQVIYFARMLAETDERVTNIVIMGMGEPFHNYEATLKAIDTLNDHDGFNFGERRFTISTVGLVPMIYKFANEKRQINLAISLHATDNKLRSSMIPISEKHTVEEIITACRQYVAQTNRRITFEWALIQGVNDSAQDAKDLADMLHGLLCHVNVIPLNPTNDFEGQASSKKQAQLFQTELESHHIPCTIRLRRGIEIAAGCGQLASEH